jgi:hypothetical protein
MIRVSSKVAAMSSMFDGQIDVGQNEAQTGRHDTVARQLNCGNFWLRFL